MQAKSSSLLDTATAGELRRAAASRRVIVTTDRPASGATTQGTMRSSCPLSSASGVWASGTEAPGCRWRVGCVSSRSLPRRGGGGLVGPGCALAGRSAQRKSRDLGCWYARTFIRRWIPPDATASVEVSSMKASVPPLGDHSAALSDPIQARQRWRLTYHPGACNAVNHGCGCAGSGNIPPERNRFIFFFLPDSPGISAGSCKTA